MSTETWFNRWDRRLSQTAAEFSYPRTPDIAAQLRAERMAALVQAREQAERVTRVRRMAFAVVIVLALGIGLWSVPPVRATIVSFLRIGAVTIVLEPTATPRPTSTPQSTETPQPTPTGTFRITPTVTPRSLGSVLDLGGETTLAQARADVRFPIRLPTYPADLGVPDAVFVQKFDGDMVVLAWMDEAQPNRVHLSLHILDVNGAYVKKMMPGSVQETFVNRRFAVWTTGPYTLQARDGAYYVRRLIEGHTLIWTDGDLTYRLETDLSLAEAVKIAESLR